MTRNRVARLPARKAPSVVERPLTEDLVGGIGHRLELVRIVLAERHDRGAGLDSGEVSSLHYIVNQCSTLLWNNPRALDGGRT